jgi:hypothetical protein
MISFRQKGDFYNFKRYLGRVVDAVDVDILDEYGRQGVAALSSATPVDSGATAASWYYEIERGPDSAVIRYCNSNVSEGVPVAIILQYGHGTGTGGWVEGADYINPALRPIFDGIATAAWREVTKL